MLKLVGKPICVSDNKQCGVQRHAGPSRKHEPTTLVAWVALPTTDVATDNVLHVHVPVGPLNSMDEVTRFIWMRLDEEMTLVAWVARPALQIAIRLHIHIHVP